MAIRKKGVVRTSTEPLIPEVSTEVVSPDMKKILEAILTLDKKIEVKIEELDKKIEVKIEELDKKIEAKIEELDKRIEVKIEVETQIIKEVVNSLSGELKDTQGKVQKLEEKTEDVIKDMEDNLDRMALAELREKEYILRLRAVPEQEDEDTRGRMICELAKFLEREEQELDIEIDKIFRVNSRYARIKKVSRDILVYFVRKVTKEQILRKHYNSRLNIEGVEIIVLKEIPSRILRKRKEYLFLTNKLRAKNISFRWQCIICVQRTEIQNNFCIKSKSFSGEV